ncbi:MAG: metal-dependent transcriptional regulator [Candidatus Sumerlaeia bacterium]|nr:metal-dependent transcriptional regulator [Candidatus Sumerlaeia bacterium]
MKVWKEFEEHEISHSMAHYLMAIHDVFKAQGYCRVTDVARELEITPGSASVSIKALKQRGYVDEDHNRFLRLSPLGERTASEIHASNVALASFLREVLGVSESQANIDACKVEHLVSSETRAKLLGFLHFIHGHGNEKVVRDFLDAFRAHKDECPGPEACDACEIQCVVHTAVDAHGKREG